MPAKRFDSIQALRAVAALWVVAFHTTGNATTYGWSSGFLPSLSSHGEMGVDIFFIISGFVIAFISYGKPVGYGTAWRFIVARVSRIIPLYWALTALFTALLVFAPSAFGHARLSLWHIVSSFLFIPSLNWASITAPVINVGWTLNYEIWFYILFTLIICYFKRPLIAITLTLAAIALIHPLHSPGIIWNFYTNSIILEFSAGILLGGLYATGKKITPFIATPLMSVSGIIIYLYDYPPTEETRFIIFGLPAFSITALALFLENRILWSRFLISLGNASYSLYLTHVLTVPVSLKLAQSLDKRHAIPGDLVCLIVIAISITIACICYRYIEHPMSRAARHWLTQRIAHH